MQHEQKSPKNVAKVFMAGILAVLLLAFGVVAASGAWHHSSDHSHNADAGACVICSLAQGQIDLSDASPILAGAVLFPLCGLLAASAGVPWSLHFLLPPGRAPPGISHSL
jgi:hypothetical protein